jgi:RNA 3'-terminal phosphate cyclase (ATP)
MLARMGVCAQLHLDRHGFYPAGGGKVRATVEPCASATPCVVDDDAGEATITATALISALTPEIGMRELKVVARHFALGEDATTLVSIPNAVGPGNALMIRVQRAGHVEIFTGFGERGVSAEQVAHRLVSEVDVYLASGAMVGEHLADQLLMPMALAGSGAFTTTAPSEHLISNAALIEKFLPVEIAREQLDAHKWRVSVTS